MHIEGGVIGFDEYRNLCCCSVAKLCPILGNLMDCSTPGFPVLHYLQEFAQTHVHWVSDATQPSQPLSSASLFAFKLSQHQSLFLMSWFYVSGWPKYWSFSFRISPSNERSGLISFRIDWFDLLTVQGTFKSLLQHPRNLVLDDEEGVILKQSKKKTNWDGWCLKEVILFCSKVSLTRILEHYSATKKNKIMPRVDLEMIILNELSQKHKKHMT